MENFTFKNTTGIVFGKGAENCVGDEVKKITDRVLIHYGKSSIKKNGLYDRVIHSLTEAGVTFLELGGVEPNPRLDLVQKGIELCRENKIKFILGIGGGSVIDSAKAIAVGVPYSGDVWDFYCGKAVPVESLGVGTILTIPAAGSESSPSSVITNMDGQLKRGLTNSLLHPVFSILNPELTYTLPAWQTACGAADIMAHIMERYFTNTQSVELTDRLCEATMKTVIENVPRCLSTPNDYNSRAEIMWAGTVAHNDLLGTGRIGDWASHQIEHEISGIYDVAHGAGLAVVFPAWMKYVYKSNIPRFVQFASRVWNLEVDFHNQEKTAFEGILKLESFFSSIGLPIRLAAMSIGDDRIGEMADKATGYGKWTAGNFVKLSRDDIAAILRSAA